MHSKPMAIVFRTLTILVLVSALGACGPAGEHSHDTTKTPAEPAAHDDHDDHDPGEPEGEHGEEATVHLEAEQLEGLGITTAVAGPGVIHGQATAPGEVRINGDRMAHVAPRVGGVVEEVFASLGDQVRRGQLLAVLHSRELADITAEYLAADARVRLATASFEREERLWNQKVSSEQDFLDARTALSEARIALRSAQEKLLALGLAQQEIAEMPDQHDHRLTRYLLSAPFDGVVIDRHLTQGESVEAETVVFTIADLSTVWIDLDIYQKDLGRVHAGDTVRLMTDHGHERSAVISFVQPVVGEDTRTALARVVVPNPDGRWHPGCFVSARVATGDTEVAVRVPRSALVRLGDEGHLVVFVQEGDAFAAREAVSGRSDRLFVEITDGLEAGETYVAEGAFNLKAELGKGAFGHGHAH